MTKPSRPRRARRAEHPPPANLIDGIPDRSDRPAAWKRVVLALVFLAWLGFLIYCAAAAHIAESGT
jgi:hypothetical protein